MPQRSTLFLYNYTFLTKINKPVIDPTIFIHKYPLVVLQQRELSSQTESYVLSAYNLVNEEEDFKIKKKIMKL